MSTASDLDEIIVNLKATIASNKGGVQLQNLENDYRNILGEHLPYRKFGYSTLIEFIQSIKEFKIENRKGILTVCVKSDDKSQHLVDMIKKQKSSKKNLEANAIPNSEIYNNIHFCKKNYKKILKTECLNNIESVNSSGLLNTVPVDCIQPVSQSATIPPTVNPPVMSKSLTSLSVANQSVTNHLTSPPMMSQSVTSHSVASQSVVTSHSVMCQTVMFPSVKSPPLKFKPFRTKVYAQDRLQKYVKKNIDEVECNNKICQLKVQNNSTIPVIITAVHNPSNIWAVLDDTGKNESFLEMETELNKMMVTGSQFEKKPTIGRYYALFHQQKWYRIIIENIDVNNSVKCLLIDNGKIIDVQQNDIYPLEPKYYNVCGQAFNIVLNKFNLFFDFPLINDILIEMLLNKKFSLIPNNVFTSPIIVTLYNLEGVVNINDVILNMFFERAAPSYYYFNDTNNVVNAEVLSDDKNGYWYLQVDTKILRPLENLLLTDLFCAPHLKNSREIDYRNTYLAPYKSNIRGRVKVMHFVDENSLVNVFFIDYGIYKNIEITELIDLNKIDSRIAKIPCQAVKVSLHMIPPKIVTGKVIDLFYSIIGDNKRVLVSYVKYLTRNVPCVQLICDLYPNTYVNIIMYTK